LFIIYDYGYPFRKKIPIIKLKPLYGIDEIIYPNAVKIIREFTRPIGVETSDDDDYTNNMYDKGDLMPINYFDNEKNENYLWSYLNCSLMHKTLKEGLWRILVDYEQSLHSDSLYKVDVEIIANFTNQSKKVNGGATIPNSFTKIITYSSDMFNKKEIIQEVYTFPNNNSVEGKKKEDFLDKNLSGNFIIH
tara:strand:+ start:313 stop:885 length:573 start_codon:yes stop_codon:yes gene_type:complete